MSDTPPLSSPSGEAALARKVRELEAVRSLLLLACRATDTHDLIHAIVTTATEVLASQAGSVILHEPLAHRLVFYEATGEAGQKLKTMTLREDQGVAGWVTQHGQTVVCNDPQHDPRFAKGFSLRVGVPVTSLLAAPLIWQNTVVGVLEVLNTAAPGGYRQEDAELLEALAAQAATALALQHEREQSAERDRLAVVGRMAGVVLHDLRNPLAVVKGHLQLLLKKDPPAETRREALETCLKNADRIGAFCEELLGYMRGKAILNVSAVNVADLLAQVCAQCAPLAQALGGELTVGAPAVASLMADGEKLLRALVNLVNNGLEAAGEGGRVRLSLTHENGQAIFDVTDTGPGMSPEQLQNCRKPFVTGKAGGAGLGLFIADMVAQGHGGALELQNQPEGGLRARLRLPCP